MHILRAREVGSVGAPHWAQEMQLALVNLSNTMQQGFKSVKVGMNCL